MIVLQSVGMVHLARRCACSFATEYDFIKIYPPLASIAFSCVSLNRFATEAA